MASIIASDSFSYPLGELSGQNGGTGWGAGWGAVTSITQVVNAVPPFTGGPTNPVLQFTGNNDNAVSRALGSVYSADQIFVDFYIQIAAGALAGNDFLGLWFDNAALGSHTSVPNIGIKADGSTNPSTNDVFARTTGTGGSFVPNSNIGSTLNTTFHIVGRLSRDNPGGGNLYDRFQVWLNPTVFDFATPGAVFNGVSSISSFSFIGFRTANLDSGDVVLIDNLKLSTTWKEAVPEPSSLALISLGLLLGIGQVRRRTA
jgi:hypothetical protein